MSGDEPLEVQILGYPPDDKREKKGEYHGS
jgi:hypothetical protein